MSVNSAHGNPGRKAYISTHLDISSGGGVERFVSILSTILKEDGWKIRIVTSENAHAVLSRMRPLAAWVIGREIRRAAGPLDIIICNNYFSWNAPRDNSMVVFHGTEMGRAIATRRVYPWYRNLLVKLVNSRLDERAAIGRCVIAVSNSTKEEVERHYGVGVHFILPIPVDTSTFKPIRDRSVLRRELGLPVDEFLVLCTGMDDARKGARIVRHEIVPRLIGRQRVVVLGKMKDCPKGMISLGRIPFDRTSDVYKACDAFVMPSYYEGAGFATVEALACGLPSVVSPTGIGKNLQQEDTLRRYVIPCEDSGGYVECLKRLQDDEAERLRVSRASRDFAVMHHDASRFRTECLRIINEITR